MGHMIVFLGLSYLFVIDCGPLESPDDGSVSYAASTYESEATYDCDPGFKLNGTATRVCNEHGIWSGNAPFCEKKGTARFDCVLFTATFDCVLYVWKRQNIYTVIEHQSLWR